MAKVNYDVNGNEIKIDNKIEKERLAAFEQISKKAILINMTRKQISNMPFDVISSQKCAKLLKVKDESLIQVRKFLFNPEHLSKIRSLINDGLLMVWTHTRPWDNIGYRLLPMEYYDDFNETFGKIKDEFEEAVKEFTDNYDTYLAESKKNLGDAFNKNDYPDKTQLNQYFELKISTATFPDIDDIRLNMSGPELMQMQKEITDKYTGTIKESVEEILKFIESGNHTMAHDLLKVTDKLNVSNDPEIELKIAEIKAELKATGNIVVDKEKKEVTEESMMVMDDIDDIDDIIDDYGL